MLDQARSDPTPDGPALPRGQRMRMLRAEDVAHMLDEALERSLSPEDGVPLRALQRRLRIEFARMLRERARAVRGMSRQAFMAELDRAHHDTLAARGQAQAELEALRAKAAESSASSGGDALELYERRIAKLNGELQRAEEALAAMADRAEADPGRPSAYRSVQGLDSQAEGDGMRAGMLRQVFADNRRLRRD